MAIGWRDGEKRSTESSAAGRLKYGRAELRSGRREEAGRYGDGRKADACQGRGVGVVFRREASSATPLAVPTETKPRRRPPNSSTRAALRKKALTDRADQRGPPGPSALWLSE